MSGTPRFPIVDAGYDTTSVEAFIVKLVERARSEIEGLREELSQHRSELGRLRTHVAELEQALCAVAEADWDPFLDAAGEPEPEVEVGLDAGGEPEAEVGFERQESEPGDESDPVDDSESERDGFVFPSAHSGVAPDDADDVPDQDRAVIPDHEPLSEGERIARMVESRIRGRRGSAVRPD